jgi:ribose transport system permease protein
LIGRAFNGVFAGHVGLPPLISTFATNAIFFGLAMTIMPLPGGYVPRFFWRWYRGDVLRIIPVPIFILLIGIAIWIIVKRTALYRYIYAVGGNEEGAYSSGIKVSNIKLMAYVIGRYLCESCRYKPSFVYGHRRSQGRSFLYP